MIREIKATEPVNSYDRTIFLGGTIDMGNSDDWQKEFKDHISKFDFYNDWTLLNPRRSNWNNDWKQHIENVPFNQQVNWELDGLTNSTMNVFVFLPDSKSPITLMELGLFKDKPCKVYCPFEFYRSGNVHIVCKRYGISYYTDWKEFLDSFEPKPFYRLCNMKTQQGLWYGIDGLFTGLIHNEFTFCKNNKLEMKFDENLVNWLSATDTLDALYEWFPLSDIKNLQIYDWYIHQYDVINHKFYDKFQHYAICQYTSKLNRLIYVT